MKWKARMSEQVAELLCGDNSEGYFHYPPGAQHDGIDNDSPSLNRTIGNNRPRSGLSNPQNTQHITTTEVAVQIPPCFTTGRPDIRP